ncbi:MAG TPA: hypothetical protein EYP29_00700 [Thermoplasmata archaeon]|nr:hypothetical protein [Thermoplasmata archaeon]
MKLLSKTYLFAISVILGVIVFIALAYFRILKYQEIYFTMSSTLVAWGLNILFAIVGGILFGMLLGYRILSVNKFTPFEKAMLEMRAEIKAMKEKFDEYEKKDLITTILAIKMELESLRKELLSQKSEKTLNEEEKEEGFNH